MRAIRAIVPLFLVGLACGQNYNATFSYDSTGMTPCSSSVSVSCLDHFEVGVLSGTTFASLATALAPTTAQAQGPLNYQTGPFSLAPGTYTIAAIAVGKDNVGNRYTSNPQLATVTVVVPVTPTLAPPTQLKVVPVP